MNDTLEVKQVREVTEILLVAWLRTAKRIYPLRLKKKGSQGVWVFECTDAFREAVREYYSPACENLRRVFDDVKSLKSEIAIAQ